MFVSFFIVFSFFFVSFLIYNKEKVKILVSYLSLDFTCYITFTECNRFLVRNKCADCLKIMSICSLKGKLINDFYFVINPYPAGTKSD